MLRALHLPDCACAITSSPIRMGFTARCWMADGFSKPYAYIPLSSSSRSSIASKDSTVSSQFVCRSALSSGAPAASLQSTQALHQQRTGISAHHCRAAHCAVHPSQHSTDSTMQRDPCIIAHVIRQCSCAAAARTLLHLLLRPP
jgi:hypothetical protein